MPTIEKNKILEMAKKKYGSVIPVPENEFNALQKSHEDLGEEIKFLKEERDGLFTKNEELAKENEILKTPSKEKPKSDTPLTKLLNKHLNGKGNNN